MYKPLMNAEPEPASAAGTEDPKATEEPKPSEKEPPQHIDRDSYYREKRLREAAEKKIRDYEDAQKKKALDEREAKKNEATALEKKDMEHEDAIKELMAKHARENLDSQTRFELKNHFSNDDHINGLMQKLEGIENSEERTEAINSMVADPVNAAFLRQTQVQPQTQQLTKASPLPIPLSAGKGGGPAPQDIHARLESTDKKVKMEAVEEKARMQMAGTWVEK
jgi:hypothetical protein